MGRIIKAASQQGMIAVTGWRYRITSRAQKGLVGLWKQENANRTFANNARWLSQHDYRNVFVDVDNEGGGRDATGWSISGLTDAEIAWCLDFVKEECSSWKPSAAAD